MRKTNRTDKIISISLFIAFITFWLQIICAFIGDRNIVAHCNMFIYMISIFVLMCTVIDKTYKRATFRRLGGCLLLWAILIILYIGILAMRGFL